MNKIKTFLKLIFFKYDYLIKKLMYPVIYDINKNIMNTKQKKILISYLSEQFFFGLDTKNSHTNYKENSLIIKYFIEKDFSIDLIECTDKNFIPKNDYYDVIFGFGEPFRKACDCNENAKKIIYLTESSPKFSYVAEKRRIVNYKQRNNISKDIKLARSGTHYLDNDLTISDYYLLIGSHYTLDTYLTHYELDKAKFLLINPTGLFNESFVLKDKSFTQNKNFLWFGSRGVIHKGLDLLTEVFSKNEELNLYAYGVNKNEHKYLKKSNNIYLKSKINVFSNDFLELVSKTNFVILPSCSEGLSTSIITCMMHGMIPIITKETGLELPNNTGFYLEDLTLSGIENTLRKIIKMETSELIERRVNCYDYAHKNFNLKSYYKTLSSSLDKVI